MPHSRSLFQGSTLEGRVRQYDSGRHQKSEGEGHRLKTLQFLVFKCLLRQARSKKPPFPSPAAATREA